MGGFPTPQKDQGGPGQSSGAAPGQPQGQQQASPLQEGLANLAKMCEQLSQQNPIVQGELMEARSAFIKALQKTMMASRPQQPNPQGPQGEAQ